MKIMPIIKDNNYYKRKSGFREIHSFQKKGFFKPNKIKIIITTGFKNISCTK